MLENRKNSDDRVVSHLELLLLVRLRTCLNFGFFFCFVFVFFSLIHHAYYIYRSKFIRISSLCCLLSFTGNLPVLCMVTSILDSCVSLGLLHSFLSAFEMIQSRLNDICISKTKIIKQQPLYIFTSTDLYSSAAFHHYRGMYVIRNGLKRG